MNTYTNTRFFCLTLNKKDTSAIDVTLDTTENGALTQFDGKPVGTKFCLYRATIVKIGEYEIKHIKVEKEK